MASQDSFGAKGALEVGDQSYQIYRLSAVTGDGLDVDSLPYSLKVLLENLLRTEDGADITADDIRALAGWDAEAEPDKEIQFTPARVIMQDFTGVPCIVDLATMREAMADLGGDATKINPLAPAELVIDHSVIADVFGTPEAFERNVEIEYQRNEERYQFLRWGQDAFDDFKVVPPGTGIVHQVNIEHLARVVFTREVSTGSTGGARRRSWSALPRHLRRHRLPHHDGQRHRRGRLGRRGYRGRGRHARTAGQHADPARGRLQAVRRAARGLDGHRPRPHDHRDAAPARRGRQVRGVLRRRRRRAARRQPRHDRQHEPGVRLDHRGLPRRRPDHQLPPADGSPRRPARPRRGLCQGAGPLARPECRASLQRAARARPVDRRTVAGRAEAAAGPRRGQQGGRVVRQGARGLHRPPRRHRDRQPRRAAGRDRPRRRRHRRHHVVHQHLQPERDDRRGPPRQERRRQGAVAQAVGQDHAGARLQGGQRLLRALRSHALPRQAGVQPRRLRLYDVHRQLRPADPRGERRRQRRPTWRSSACSPATATSRAGSTPT